VVGSYLLGYEGSPSLIRAFIAVDSISIIPGTCSSLSGLRKSLLKLHWTFAYQTIVKTV